MHADRRAPIGASAYASKKITSDHQPNKAVHDERLKLLATTINGVAVATIVAGAVTPLVVWTYGIQSGGSGFTSFLISLAWLGIGAGLHYLARRLERWKSDLV